MAIPQKYLHQTGRHKGNLKQDLLQCEGDFAQRDAHPIVKGLFYKGYSYAKKKQEWGTSDHFPKLNSPKPPKGVPENLLKHGKLNGKLLQVVGKFKKGDIHPIYDTIVFHGIRENGKQRWQTKEQHESNLKKAIPYNRKWKQEHKVEIQEYNQKYRKENEDWILAQQKK